MKKYYVSKEVFIRYEKDLPADENVIIFVVETGEMFKANKAIYDIIELIKKGLDSQAIIDELANTYIGSNKEEIELVLYKTIKNLVKLGVVIEDESIKV